MNFIYKIGYYTKNLIPISIILSVILFVFGYKQIYYNDIEYLNIENSSKISSEIIRESYDYVIDYTFSLKQTEFNIPNLKSSDNGKKHFTEVKNIVQNIIKINIASWILSIMGIIYCFKHKYTKVFLNISAQLILLPAMLSVPFIVNFSNSFVIFHKILFRNDYWIFDEKLDPIIKILPEKFFFHEAMFMLTILIVMSFTSLVIFKVLKKMQR